jgi:hypothetical protein
MHKPEYFRLIGKYPCIDVLRSDVLALDDEEWTKFTYRQKNIVGHAKTQTIPLIFDYKKRTRRITHDNYCTFEQHLDSLSNTLKNNDFPFSIERANLVKLKANSDIAPHIDKGDFLSGTHRVHVPIETNSSCWFSVGNTSQHMGVGEIWEINNTGQIHSVHNNGVTDRIHLIVDVRQ